MDRQKAVVKLINKIISVSNNSMSELLTFMQFEAIPKEKCFIKRNHRNEKEYFILDGICRSFLIDPEGEEITISFFQKNSVLSPRVARTSNGVSNLYFQALTDMEVAIIEAEKLYELMSKNPDLRNFGNKVLENELILKVEKELGLASLTAKERLIQFRERYDNLENILPHPYIASYLGITNISLSRLRRDLMKN